MNRVVVAWNGSEAARAGLRWAVEHARAASSHLIVVHAVPDDGVAVPLESADAHIRGAVGGLAEAGIDIDVQVERGDPVDVLVRSMDSATMLVVGQDRSAPETYRHRATVSRVLARVAGSVALVPTPPPERPARADVVVGVDDVTGSAAAIRFAGQEAARRGVALRAITAWSAPLGTRHDPSSERRLRERERILQLLEEHVERALTALPNLNVVRSAPEDGVIAELLRAADEAQLVVVGSGRHDGPGVGTVARAVATASPVPAVIVA
ncbi:universal stress protein [Curtobacterium ammoniigenes]|uniref:universal stress protein n=1 Tax=Curtobacterium ammoniigenes TaxID=395387 RepID=UPI00082DF7BF|nr:universal stress protein [Curtobacterium ammoniigenes]